MQSFFYHIQLNIDFQKNQTFYKNLMGFLGWQVIFEGSDVVGYKSEKSGDLWFVDSKKKELFDYDAIGVNHLAIRMENQEDVDLVAKYLTDKGIQMLFETPRHRPEFVGSEKETYYQIIFESPDKIQFEIVYIG